MDETIADWLRTVWSFISGAIVAILGYFLPIKNIVHLLILFFVLDVVFGFLAAKKLRGEKFSAKIIWKTTMPRMVISLVLILGAYMWDTVYDQNILATYKIIGWFISGVLLASIIQNGYKITSWNIFAKVGKVLGYKISEKAGIQFNGKYKNEDCQS